MVPILSVTVPFFALVLCGYLATRSRLLPESAIPGLNIYVLFFALPCMLYRFGASLPVARLIDASVIAVWLAAALLMVFGTIALTRSARVGTKDAAFGALTVAFPNTGFMGVPMLAALLGTAAAGPVITTLLIDLLITSSVAIGLAQMGDRGQLGPAASALRSIRGALSNPLPWAIGAGMVSSATGLHPIGPADTIVRMLADSATPVALFTIGTVLWRAGQHVHTRTPLDLYLPLALLKLLAHPLLVLALGWLAIHVFGAPLSSFNLTVLVLAAALPSASTASLLAERYGADNGRVTRAVVLSTALAFVTFSLLAWLADVRPH
jgi:malonate transporter and related proteins